jgi:membrane-associated phospholipid phosphatase
MKLLRKLFISILIAAFTNISFANECGSWLSNFTSPVCTDAKYIFWTGAGLTLALRLAKDPFVDEVQSRTVSKNHLKSWGEVGGEVGYGYLNALYFLGQLSFGGSKGGERAEHMFEASFYTLGVTYGLKKSISERRPGYRDDPDSFPSGHSSFAFAFASVVTANHGWAWGGLSHLVASFIAFSRMNDNWHYLHDVVAGMTIGMSYGWGVYFNHKNHNKPYWLSLYPTKGLKGLGALYTYTF